MKIGVLFSVLLPLAACSLPPDAELYSSPSPLRSTAVGCWHLESSPGLLGRPLETTKVRLDTATLRDGGMRMHLFPPVEGQRADMNQWGTTARGDTLQLWFSNGFGGVYVRARIRGGRLYGRGRTWVDTPTWFRTGPVRGIRIRCPADPAAA